MSLQSRYMTKVRITPTKKPAAATDDDAQDGAGVIHVRVTPEQRRAIETAARREGLAVSSWMRSLVLRQLNDAA